MVELGFPQLVAENFVGISGPANMPPDPLVAKPGRGRWPRCLSDPKLIARLEDLGFTVTRRMTPAEFQAYVAKQVADFSPRPR